MRTTERGVSNLVPLLPVFAIPDLIRLTLHYWQPLAMKFLTSEKDAFVKILTENRTSRCIFCKKFCKVILFWCHGTESEGLNLFLRIKGTVEQGLEHLSFLPQVVLISRIKPISAQYLFKYILTIRQHRVCGVVLKTRLTSLA